MGDLTTVRYIDANKLMSDLCLRSCENREKRFDNDAAADEDLSIVEMIKKIPVVDAVEVVRCRDCMHAIPIPKECRMYVNVHTMCAIGRGNLEHSTGISTVHPNDFCSDGMLAEED